ncbi:polysaccharide deacetylase family protein [Mucilaginibacter sp. BJC16-A38]|uniref:polysaccharide deacetylase family protein n=1 Tax=Mucilaginibacter phenanthrenivorans TaxID=1234842 RepID=UPI00215713B7|nr:polysaccharide deacetylase family protein [Mucilaginibacter phenanthrenivorans]MCR8558612.1 polysaccharide deacetylase family protein [Mucilaginibacter phenanthrenivorans]
MYLVKTPWLLKKLYPNLLWNANRSSRCIYLTFDDGPIPIVTPFVLNILKQYNAKATFFCIGDNVNKHPDIFEQVKNEGHAIGNHTYNHLKGWDTEDNIYLDNILQADKLLDTKLFRPPYGRMKRSQLKLLQEAKPGLQAIMWNVLSADFDLNVTPEQCLDNVLKNTKGGDIVLFHDSLKAKERMEYALPRAMEVWSREGYEFKCLDQNP